MLALILHDEAERAQAIADAMCGRGFTVDILCDPDRAKAYVRRHTTDVLILKHDIGGRLTASVALEAAVRNRHAVALLLTNCNRSTAIELFELVPQLQAVLRPRALPETLASVALRALKAPGAPQARADYLPRSRAVA